MPARIKSWCFTLNNWTDDELSNLRGIGNDGRTADYLVMGRESGENGTPHLQGFVTFAKKLTLERCKELLGPRCHLEPMRGTHKQASDYCKKDGDFDEYGTLPSPGARTDLGATVQLLRDSKSISTVANQFPETFIRYSRGIRDFYFSSGLSGTRDFKTEVIVFVGPPGIGKSRLAREEADAIGRVYYKPNGDWWDGYDNQDVVIFDDFYGNYPYHDLLKVCDRYPHQVPIKGGFANFTSKSIYFTSNKLPSRWYNYEKVGAKEALYRRFTRFEYFTTGGGRVDATTVEENETGVKPVINY
ncbi:replication-associated protein [Wastewater CRESS DNA virus 1]|nr:replication-associated protein [Wastewater CRESS DNA virus 1]